MSKELYNQVYSGECPVSGLKDAYAYLAQVSKATNCHSLRAGLVEAHENILAGDYEAAHKCIDASVARAVSKTTLPVSQAVDIGKLIVTRLGGHVNAIAEDASLAKKYASTITLEAAR